MTTPATWDRLLALGIAIEGVPILDADGRPALARDINASSAFAITYNAGQRRWEWTLSASGAGAIAGTYEPTADRLLLRNGAAQIKVTATAPTESGQIAHSVGRPVGYGQITGDSGNASHIVPFRRELSSSQQFYKFTADGGPTTETLEVFGFTFDNAELVGIEFWFYGTVTPDDTNYGLITIESTDMFGDDIVLAAIYTTETSGSNANYDRMGGAPVTAFQLITLTFQPPVTPPYIVDGGRYIQMRILKGGGTLGEGGTGITLPRMSGRFTTRLTNTSVEHPA